MMLQKGKDVPKDSVKLTEQEALSHQYDIIKNWTPTSEVVSIRYGSSMLGIATVFTATFLNNHYRTKLRLFNIARFSSYLPTVIIPTTFSIAGHFGMVVPDVLLLKECPVCIELRAAALQAFSGMLLPSILAPLATFGLAGRFATYNVPSLVFETRKVLQLWAKLTKPVAPVLFTLFTAHAVAGSAVAYHELKSMSVLNKKLAIKSGLQVDEAKL